MDGNNTQCRYAHGHHGIGSREHSEKRFGEEHKEDHADEHQYFRHKDGEFDGIVDAFAFPCTVVVGYNGDHPAVETENGHEDDALEFEVRAKDRRCRLGKADEDAVDAKGHHRADGLHDDGGETDFIDDADHFPIGFDVFEMEMKFGVVFFIEIDGKACGHGLTENGSDGGTQYFQAGNGAKAENKNGVQNDVDDGTQPLGDHGVEGFPRGLEQTLHGVLNQHCKGKNENRGEILHTVGINFGVCPGGLAGEKGFYRKKTEEKEDHRSAKSKENPVTGGTVGFGKVLFPQGAGKNGIDPHTGPTAKSDDQHLHGKGQRYGGKGIFGDQPYENTVDDVIKGKHRHGDHHRQGNFHQYFGNGQIAHDIFRRTIGCGFL